MGRGSTKSCLPAASLRKDQSEKGRGSPCGGGSASRTASGAATAAAEGEEEAEVGGVDFVGAVCRCSCCCCCFAGASFRDREASEASVVSETAAVSVEKKPMIVVGCLERRIFVFPSFREKNKERGKGSETPTPTALIESL